LSFDTHDTSRRARGVLRKLVDSKLASPEALGAVLNLADPFPDGAYSPCGFPDGFATPSVRTTYNAEYQVSAPAGLAAGQTWDLHVWNPPVLGNSQVGALDSFEINEFGFINVGPGIAGAAPGLFNIYTGASGSLVSPLAMTPVASFSPTSTVANNLARIVACGAELINTSADLYRGGMGYAYRLPCKDQAAAIDVGATYLFSAAETLQFPPQSPAEIINYSSTYQGKARDGVVFVNTPLSFSENYPTPKVPSKLLWYDPDVTVGPNALTKQYNRPACEWNQAGGFITGLTQGATITVRMRAGFEVFPSVRDNDLFAIARATVSHSPALEEMFLAMLAEMPAGFDYAENPLGEWFDKIVNAIAEYAPVIAPVLGAINPVLGMVAGGVGKGAGALQAYRKEKSDKKKAKGSKQISQ